MSTLKAAEYGNESAEVICRYLEVVHDKNRNNIKPDRKPLSNNFANGFMHLHGERVTNDLVSNFALALKYFEASAKIDNDEYGQHMYGLLLSGGWGVPKDIGLAEYWYTKSAAQGYSYALRQLGEILIQKADSLKLKLQ
jgi:TPR repeat protein